ncbi:MAG: hypothetical protein ABI550_00720 [Ignavibacteriaceae bacterium]
MTMKEMRLLHPATAGFATTELDYYPPIKYKKIWNYMKKSIMSGKNVG